ncbi:ABC-type multidrug transport system fused ATPase/permease subunit [Peteryoungia aggregata LMG 23059]|uniref:ABC-type multidrug transport system fused ATPase/permease subunit n=1 Tax=Peteryoungia aggregata LMG 23059 TaxID=1368425 RepID=A0ABU0G9J0_9HYPH|nr:ABC transporter ATP-binding protein [Peteryoungia aggregata]MDQ0421748.1 ABC-type multidrug transport system fused ATPase/permease subunit [Peteryoungia aggregata LMG 23059]
MTLSDRIFTPFERLLRPLEVPYRRIPSDGPLRLVLHFVAYAPKSFLVVLALSASVEIVNLTVLWGVSHLIDGISSQGLLPYLDAHRWPLAAFVALFFPVLPLLIFFCNALGVHVLSVSLPTLIQWHGHKAVESQDLGFFHDQFSGQVASRIAQVAGAVKQQMAAAVWTLPIFFVQMVGSVVLLTALSWSLTLPVLVWIAINAVIAKQAVPQFSATAKTAARARSRVVGEMTDLYSNIQTVKLFAAEDSEAGALRRVMERSMSAQFRERRIGLTADLLVISSNTLLFIAIFAVSLWGIADGFVTLGEFVAAITITQRLASNSRGFLSLGQQISEAIGTIRDAMPVMTTPPTVVDVPEAKALIVERGEIRFDCVSFEYHDSQQVIHDLSLSVSAGEKVGLVGLSGAGKTTLVSLLLRLYDLDGGRIVIDGQDVADVTQASLRAQIGFIAQDVSLLHRSVGDNILYGRPGAAQAELEAAAHLAQADAFIADLKDSEGRTGYAAYVGDRGVKLSGGQRQRVAIARVLLKDAPILVLDEATSALDSEAEATIQEKLDLLMEGKTVIAIAHRLSTIARMDRIVVLDKGRIIEEGRPDDLLSSGGLYSRLWARQTGGYIASVDD